jgi:RNA 2',3'-cyclic 3'-phosphodiesterase
VRLFLAVYPPPAACTHLGHAVDDLAVGRAAAAGTNARLTGRANWHLTVAFLGEVAEERLDDVESAVGRAVAQWHAGTAPGRRADIAHHRHGDIAPGGRADVAPGRHGDTAPGRNGDTAPGRHADAAPSVRADAVPAPRRHADTAPRSHADAVPAPRLRLAGGGRFGRGRFTVLWVGVRGDVDRLVALGRASRRQLRRARLSYDEKPMRPHLTLGRPGERLDPEAIKSDVAALDAYEGPWWAAEELVLVRSHLGPKPAYDRLAAWPLGTPSTG